MEHWLPFFHARLETLFDYLPAASVMLDDQVTPARLSRWEGIADQYDARREAMSAKGRLDTVYKPCAPDLLYLDDAAWEAAVADHRVVQLSPLAAIAGAGCAGCHGPDRAQFRAGTPAGDRSAFSAPWPIIFRRCNARPSGGHRLVVRGCARAVEGAVGRSGPARVPRRSRISARCPKGTAGFT